MTNFNQMNQQERARLGDKQHVGGHYGFTHLDEGALDFMVQTFNVKSMIDIGCGPGGMVQLAQSKGLRVLGVDGDDTIERAPALPILIHDYAKGPLRVSEQYDMAWCVEFVEHVDHEYMPNFIATFQCCSVVLMTYAPPGQIGHHHVNCMPFEYWLGVMHFAGFEPLLDATQSLRQKSTMRDIFMKNTGTIFAKRDILFANNIAIPRPGLALAP